MLGIRWCSAIPMPLSPSLFRRTSDLRACGGGGGKKKKKGWKRCKDIGPCLRGEKDTHRFEDIFFNEMSSKKQTACRTKRLRVVCAAQK
ncbi:hypothetical protein Hanom_Chr17g01561861 [Helianthus anomalus]